MKIGDIVKINNPSVLTHGKIAVITEWAEGSQKWEVSFDGSWIGWYKEEELILEQS